MGCGDEPRVTAEDVYNAARYGVRSWRFGGQGRVWRLTRDEVMSIDRAWDGDPDELSPMVAQAVADALNRQMPWRASPADDCDELDRALSWADGIDTSRPSPSRVYDYLLGGSHNFGPDRHLASRLLAAEPRAGQYAAANRSFLHRAVRVLLDAGVEQFLDLGSGVPTVGNVHQAAQRLVPHARVVYVDVDPIAVAHSNQVLRGNPYATAIEVDLRRPELVLAHPQTRRLLDLGSPVGLLMVAVLHFVADEDDPAGIIARYRQALAPGSYLAVSHACPPRAASVAVEVARAAYRSSATPLTLRRPEQVGALLGGWRLVPPGLVEVTRWRPDDQPAAAVPGVAAVGVLEPAGEPTGEVGGSGG